MDISGRVVMIGQPISVSANFVKRDFVVSFEDNPMYPQPIQFQATQQRCDALNAVSVGDQVKVYFNIRGREWTSPQGEVKYFNTLEMWKIENLGKATVAVKAQEMSYDEFKAEGDEDDLPW